MPHQRVTGRIYIIISNLLAWVSGIPRSERKASNLIYDDFIGQTLYADDATGNEYSKSPLIPAKGKQWGSMLRRMGRKEMSARNERDED